MFLFFRRRLSDFALQILSGRQPYHYIATDAQVVIELHKGNKPRRPTQSFVNDGQWELIQWCWTQPPEDRPDVHDVVDRITNIIEEGGEQGGCAMEGALTTPPGDDDLAGFGFGYELR